MMARASVDGSLGLRPKRMPFTNREIQMEPRRPAAIPAARTVRASRNTKRKIEL
jgi:hypothetical protein